MQNLAIVKILKMGLIFDKEELYHKIVIKKMEAKDEKWDDSKYDGMLVYCDKWAIHCVWNIQV
jgi:hypothetical protein